MNFPINIQRNVRRALATLPLLALVACGSVPKRTFTIDAIDSDNYRKPWPCMVVVDGDWPGAVQREQYVNLNGNQPLQLELTFDKPKHQIEVVPVPVVNGKVDPVVKTEIQSYNETSRRVDRRELLPGDATKQLFVIAR